MAPDSSVPGDGDVWFALAADVVSLASLDFSDCDSEGSNFATIDFECSDGLASDDRSAGTAARLVVLPVWRRAVF